MCTVSGQLGLNLIRPHQGGPDGKEENRLRRRPCGYDRPSEAHFGTQGIALSDVCVDSMILAYCDEEGAPLWTDDGYIWSNNVPGSEPRRAQELLWSQLAAILV